MRHAIAPLVVAGALAFALNAAGSNSTAERQGARSQPTRITPKTLLSVRGSIQGFAQDGPWMVWANAEAPCHRRVMMRRVTGGPARSLLRKRGVTCRRARSDDEVGYQHRMALAGTRAVWAIVNASSSRYEFSVRTSSLADRLERELIRPAIDKEGGFRPVPVAGDGASLVYVDTHEIPDAGTGVGNYRVFRVGREITGVPATAGTAAVSVTGRLFAAARVLPGGCACSFQGNWSPDGRRIAFFTGRRSWGRMASDLHVLEADGSNDRQLTNGVEEVWAAWSPDGTRLAFTDGVRGAFTLVVLDVATGRRHVIGPGEDPRWSPDGSRIAVIRRGSKPGIYVLAANGNSVRRLVSRAVYRSLDWSPDGARIAGHWSGGAFVTTVDRGGFRTLYGDGEPARSVAWSPDASRIAFSAGDYDREALYVADADGSRATRIGEARGSIQYAWSPDARRLGLVRRLSGSESESLYIAAADGSAVRQLATDARGFDWSPDGTEIAFADGQVVYVTADGSSARRLVAGASPQWSPDATRLAIRTAPGRETVVSRDGSVLGSFDGVGFRTTWSPDGTRLLYESSTAYGQSEVAVATGDGRSTRNLTNTVPDPPAQRVEIRNTTSGALIARFPLQRKPLAMALSAKRVAVLVTSGRTRWIEVRTRTGRLQRSVRVPPATRDISMGGRHVVFAAGKAIRVLDARTGRARVLTVTPQIPVGLSIEGRRVAWAEQTWPTSHIRAIVLPAG